MIQDYKNIDEIKNTLDPVIKAETISIEDRKLLQMSDVPVNFDFDKSIIELHVYSDTDDLVQLISIQNVKSFIELRSSRIQDFFVIGEDVTDKKQYVYFDVNKFFAKFYPYFSAKVKISFNYLTAVASNEKLQDLTTFEISATRNEARIKYTKNDNLIDFNQIFSKYDSTDVSISKNVFVNFGNDNLFTVLNILVESPDSVIFRFYDPLPSDINIKQACYVCEKLINTNIVSTELFGIEPESVDTSIILLPNFKIDVDIKKEIDYTYKSISTLVPSNSELILPQFSSSIENLNIDFSEYKNFVYYSSAVDRLNNFVYKLGKIEEYDADILAYSSSIATLTALNSSSFSVSQSKIAIEQKKNQIFESFTPYEKYLYYVSSSYYTGSLGERFDSAWPKQNSSRPYTLYSITSSTAETWYTNQLTTASLFDSRNQNALSKTIPLFISEDSDNNDYIKFVNLISEYFDELRLYIKNITEKDVYKLKDNEGITNKIAEKFLEQFGLNIFTDLDKITLDKYLINVSEDGSLNSIQSSIKKNVFYKKLLNNLVYFLKTKGTINNLHALANLFGIDRDYYEIREYGGPNIKTRQFNSQSLDTTSLEFLNLEYSLNFSGAQNVKTLWQDYNSKKPDSIIFKFKITDSSATSQSLFESENKFAVIAQKTNTSSQSGILTFLLSGSDGYKSSSTSEIPVFNGNFWNVMLQRSVSTSSVNVNQTYTLKANTVQFDRINFYVSASLNVTGSMTSSYNGAYNTSTNFYIGGIIPTSSILKSTPLIGNVSDLKFYRVVLRDDIFKQQSLAQTMLISNEISSSFEDLVTYFTFSENKNLSLTSSIYDSNLSSFGKNHGTASGFTSNTYQVRYEKNIVKPKTIQFKKPTNEKVRIENNFVNNSDGYIYLNSTVSVETSSFDRYGLDSNRLDFIFSPTNIENKNIISLLNPEIYDFIGDPSYLLDDVETYEGLTNFYKYYRKYKSPIDLQNYIDNTYKLSKNLFKNIKQFAPERVDFNVGISIEPNILERTNVVINKSVSISNLVYTSSIISKTPSLVNEYILYTASLDNINTSVASEYLVYTSSIDTNTITINSNYSVYQKTISYSLTSSADYLFKGTGDILSRNDRIFTQGVKLRNLRTSFVTSSDGPNFYTITNAGVYEPATASFIVPISDFKYTPTYDTASENFYYTRNSAMEPLSDGTYTANHVRYYLYRPSSPFKGSLNTGPEYPTGATTIDGGKVIEITFVSPNKLSVVSTDEDKPRLKVDGVDLDI